jgi:hypothetical protein
MCPSSWRSTRRSRCTLLLPFSNFLRAQTRNNSLKVRPHTAYQSCCPVYCCQRGRAECNTVLFGWLVPCRAAALSERCKVGSRLNKVVWWLMKDWKLILLQGVCVWEVGGKWCIESYYCIFPWGIVACMRAITCCKTHLKLKKKLGP